MRVPPVRALRPVPVVLAVLLVPLVIGGAPQDDAGSGGDASPLRAAPTAVPGPGAYGGEMRSQDDDDWYAYARTPDAVCVTLDATGSPDALYTLALRSGTSERAVKALLPKGEPLRLTLAASRASVAIAGFEPVPNPVNKEPARPGGYAFTLSEARASAAWEDTLINDAGSPLSGAFTLYPSCTMGRLRPANGVGDTLDAWSFTGRAGQQVVYSLGATGAMKLDLVAADGKAIGPTVPADGIGSVTLPTDGTYYMQASAVGGTEVISYVIGIIGPDPPGHPCRPYCMTSG